MRPIRAEFKVPYVSSFRRSREMFGIYGSSWHRCNAFSFVAERIEQKQALKMNQSSLRWIKDVGAVALGDAADAVVLVSLNLTSRLGVEMG